VWTLAQQVNCSAYTVYCIFGTTHQLFIRYCILYIWHNRSTVHQILYIVYLGQQINCSLDNVYCTFGTADQLLIRYYILYIWHNRSTAHQIMYIVHLAQQINCSSAIVYCIFITHTLHKKYKCHEAVHHLSTYFKPAYDSVRWQVFITL
jgi:type IV secretory pathway VirB3-like protein